MQLNIHVPGNDVYYTKAEFTNTYTYSETRYELPFTKTVKLGGSAAPGQENFELESSMSASEAWRSTRRSFIRLLSPPTGAGDYDGRTGHLRPGGFGGSGLSARASMSGKKNAGAANWTYDDAVWHILPERTGYIVDVDASLVNNLPADTQSEKDANKYRLVIHATKREESDNGVHYADSEAPADKMTFTNTYTRSSGGGSSSASNHGKQDRRSRQAPCRRILRAEGQPGTEAYQPPRRQRHRALTRSAAAPIRCWKRLRRRVM